jgi:hypothetical protein
VVFCYTSCPETHGNGKNQSRPDLGIGRRLKGDGIRKFSHNPVDHHYFLITGCEHLEDNVYNLVTHSAQHRVVQHLMNR